MNKKLSTTIYEILPLIFFFVFYKFYGIIAATIAVLASTIIANVLSYYQTKQISKVSIISTAIIGVFGILTIISNDSTFIKIKPTIINIIFASILIIGLFQKKSYLKPILEHAISISEMAWLELTKRFALFFVFLALLNEVMWRFFPESTWVLFKVFGILGLTLIFMMLQVPFISRNAIEKK